MKIITISGLDGSGKSTQIDMLTTYLQSRNSKVFYFHSIRFGLANKIAALKKQCMMCRILAAGTAEENNDNSVIKANRLQIMLRKIFLRIDLCRFKSLVKRLKKQGYNYLLSDRYFYDNVINIQYLAKRNRKIHAEKFIVKPDTAIYLSVDPNVIMRRARTPDQGIEYLADKKKLYDAAALAWSMKVVDGNRPVQEIFNQVAGLSVSAPIRSLRGKAADKPANGSP